MIAISTLYIIIWCVCGERWDAFGSVGWLCDIDEIRSEDSLSLGLTGGSEVEPAGLHVYCISAGRSRVKGQCLCFRVCHAGV